MFDILLPAFGMSKNSVCVCNHLNVLKSMTVLVRSYFVSRKQISRLERNDKEGLDDDMGGTETQNKDSIVRILVNVERKQHLLCELYCSLGFQHSKCLCSSITHCIYDLFLLKLRRVSFDHSQDHVSSSTSDTTLVDDSPMQAM